MSLYKKVPNENLIKPVIRAHDDGEYKLKYRRKKNNPTAGYGYPYKTAVNPYLYGYGAQPFRVPSSVETKATTGIFWVYKMSFSI